jgi:hypothetical protein
MFFKKRGGAGQEKKRERKRERVIRFLDEIFKSHDLSNILLEYLKSHLRQLPPDVKNALKDALGVETTRNEAPLAKPKIIPEPPRENTFQEIDDLIFDRIKTIVSQASPDERFPQGFSNHLLDPNDPEKGMLDAKIRGLQYNSVVNLISRIRKELNANVSGEQKDVLNDEPNLEAVLAIKGLMNALTKATQSDGNIKITGLSNHAEVNRFITACFQEPKDIFKRHDYQSLDHQYYAFVVGNAKFLLDQEYCMAYDPSKTQQWG